MRTVLVTGANKGIGLETTKKLLQQGYCVYLESRDIQKGRQTVNQLKAMSLTQVEPVLIDINHAESIKAVYTTAIERVPFFLATELYYSVN